MYNTSDLRSYDSVHLSLYGDQVPAEPEIVYRVFRCDNGHQWDAFGTMNDEGDFVADDLQVYLCPTCDSVMVEDAEPENLT